VKILVTGGAGFIGSHTVELLLQRGHSVRVLDSLSPPVHVAQRLPDYVPAEVEFILGDVRDRGAWERALDSVEAVFHLAAYQDYLPDFSKFFHVNAVGTALLYEIAVEKKLSLQKIVIASSQAVYGEGLYLCVDHGAQYPGQRPLAQLQHKDWELKCPVCGQTMKPGVTDESVVMPHNSYAMSKRAQEQIGLNLGRRYELPSVALRYSIVQGARQSFRNAYSGALRIFVMQALAGRPLTIYEDGGQLRDYVYVGDVARANLLVFEDERANYGAFNVGAGRACSVLEFGRVVQEVTGHAAPMEMSGQYRLGDTRHIVSDISRLRALGWEPEGHPARSVAEYVAWAQAQPDFRNLADEAVEHMRKVGTVRATRDG
jgi:dTDP-L-rhamnose 4-epimerase